MNRAEWLVSVINERGYTSGIELGVKAGATLEHLLENCPSLKMYGVDLWNVTPGYEDWDHVDNKSLAQSVQKRFGDRLSLIEDCTWDSADMFPDKYLDFVFVDGDHRTESVLKDLKAWLPKIKKGGMISGHDIGWSSVRSAVEHKIPDYQRAGHDNCWFKFV